jgi:hypothetical protein
MKYQDFDPITHPWSHLNCNCQDEPSTALSENVGPLVQALKSVAGCIAVEVRPRFLHFFSLDHFDDGKFDYMEVS